MNNLKSSLFFFTLIIFIITSCSEQTTKWNSINNKISSSPQTQVNKPVSGNINYAEASKDSSLLIKPSLPEILNSSIPLPLTTTEPSLDISNPIATTNPIEESKYFYFSYDDSASTVGAELTKNALKNNTLPQKEWARVYEFFNLEKFDNSSQEKIGLFSVSMGLWKHRDIKDKEKSIYELGTYISSPTIDLETRKNLVLTLLIDVSGSMDEPSAPKTFEVSRTSKLDLVKYALEILYSNGLKTGDTINICQFSDEANTLLENYQFNPNDTKYLDIIKNLHTIGSTNLNAGIDEAYKVALKYYDSNKTNRVVILTDAYANTGEVDPKKISQKTKINNQEGIYFSGLGVGQDFNEEFLNELTEAGKGAYFSIISKGDAKRVFSDRLIALLNVAAKDVQFRLDYPRNLKHISSAAEQVSTIKEKVSTTNFSYNTSQFFLEGFTELNKLNSNERFKLTVTYKDPDTGEQKTEVYEKSVEELLDKNIDNIKDAYTILVLNKLIKEEYTPEDAQKALEVIGDYKSMLYSEYINLINKYISLKFKPTPYPIFYK